MLARSSSCVAVQWRLWTGAPSVARRLALQMTCSASCIPTSTCSQCGGPHQARHCWCARSMLLSTAALLLVQRKCQRPCLLAAARRDTTMAWAPCAGRARDPPAGASWPGREFESAATAPYSFELNILIVLLKTLKKLGFLHGQKTCADVLLCRANEQRGQHTTRQQQPQCLYP